MAALLFNMVLDALHFGFKHNPLKRLNQHPGAHEGYDITSQANESTNISSIGFADDTNCPARSWKSAKLAHAWLLDFLTRGTRQTMALCGTTELRTVGRELLRRE